MTVPDRPPAYLAPPLDIPPFHGRLPAFFVIGAAKAGTTSLHAYLDRHPDVFLCQPKEPTFFSNPIVWRHGLRWYSNLFADARPEQLCGEASTTYSCWPNSMDTPALIARLIPHARFIYLLRDPVDRMWSQYLMWRRLGSTGTFEEMVRDCPWIFDASRYRWQLERYLRFFDRDQLLVLRHEDLLEQPDKVLTRVQEYLGLPVMDLLSQGPVRANVSSSAVHVRQRTTVRWRRLPFMGAVADAVPPRVRDRVFNVVLRSPMGRRHEREGQPTPMRAETRARLIDFFETEVAELEEFLGEDLSRWSSHARGRIR
jgi:hypothetical protein